MVYELIQVKSTCDLHTFTFESDWLATSGSYRAIYSDIEMLLVANIIFCITLKTFA